MFTRQGGQQGKENTSCSTDGTAQQGGGGVEGQEPGGWALHNSQCLRRLGSSGPPRADPRMELLPLSDATQLLADAASPSAGCAPETCSGGVGSPTHVARSAGCNRPWPLAMLSRTRVWSTVRTSSARRRHGRRGEASPVGGGVLASLQQQDSAITLTTWRPLGPGWKVGSGNKARLVSRIDRAERQEQVDRVNGADLNSGANKRTQQEREQLSAPSMDLSTCLRLPSR